MDAKRIGYPRADPKRLSESRLETAGFVRKGPDPNRTSAHSVRVTHCLRADVRLGSGPFRTNPARLGSAFGHAVRLGSGPFRTNPAVSSLLSDKRFEPAFGQTLGVCSRTSDGLSVHRGCRPFSRSDRSGTPPRSVLHGMRSTRRIATPKRPQHVRPPTLASHSCGSHAAPVPPPPSPRPANSGSPPQT